MNNQYYIDHSLASEIWIFEDPIKTVWVIEQIIDESDYPIDPIHEFLAATTILYKARSEHFNWEIIKNSKKELRYAIYDVLKDIVEYSD